MNTSASLHRLFLRLWTDPVLQRRRKVMLPRPSPRHRELDSRRHHPPPPQRQFRSSNRISSISTPPRPRHRLYSRDFRQFQLSRLLTHRILMGLEIFHPRPPTLHSILMDSGILPLLPLIPHSILRGAIRMPA